jgi:Phosphoinositide polyphosphatase (Sac family)
MEQCITHYVLLLSKSEDQSLYIGSKKHVYTSQSHLFTVIFLFLVFYVLVNPAADILFQATKKHFADLYSLYGPQIFVLNLVKKQNKREELLTAEFQNAIEYLNRDIPNDLKITYYHQDMKALLKRDREEFLSTTSAFAKIAIEKLGFFCAKIDPLDK